MYRENANKPTTGKGREGREMLREGSEKQREKVKDVKAKKRKKKWFKKARPGVEGEMKMNERCSSGM